MDHNNPQHHISLLCSQPRPENSDEDIWYFPPCLEEKSTDPAPSVSAHPRSRHSKTERINTPPASPVHVHSCSPRSQAMQRVSHKIPLRSRRDRKPNTGLGRANVLNMVGAGQHGQAPSHQTKSPLKRDSELQDVSEGRPLKKQRLAHDKDDIRWVRDEITGVKESLEQMAAEAREGREDLNNSMQELLQEIRRRP